MKTASRPSSLDWKRILIIALVLGVGGYQWYIQNVKNPPAENRDTVATVGGDANYDAKLPDGFEPNSKRQPQIGSRSSRPEPSSTKDSSADWAHSNESPAQEFLVSVGGDRLQSPAGLIYGMGGGGEHRVDHVLNHAVDDPRRPVHGVFDGDRDSILKLIDEAYEMIKSKSKNVESDNSRGNTAYTVSMGRKIGYEGGQKGKRDNRKSLDRIKLILDGNRVITAYPFR
jgi:hypothetical protein